MNELELNENDFELVVSEKKIGNLVTNALQIKSMVENALPRFSIENYSSENIDKAKKDKAILNKAAKALNSKRIEIEKEFMKPFSGFKSTVSDTIKLIDECSSKIDYVVKNEELVYKAKKRNSLLSYYYDKLLPIPFERIEKSTWLNKGEKESKIFEEIDSITESIKQNLETLSSMKDGGALAVYYKNCLDFNRTIQYSNQLEEERSKKEAEEKERAIKETEEQKEQDAQPEQSPEPQPTLNTPEQKDQAPEIYVRTFRVECSRAQLIALGDFMNDNGIKFEKV